MNCCFENGIFPTKWKIANVTLIPKEGKDTSLPSSYRPICLLSCWEKVLDKLITKRLVDFLENKRLISENQFGFRRKRSTIDALRKAIEFVKDMKVNNKIVAMISLDTKNAFNSASWSDIKMLLNKHYVPKHFFKIFGNFLQNRSVLLENEMEPWKYNVGVPQGSCAGPILWLLIANEALNKFGVDTEVKVQAFVDDFVVLIGSTAVYHFSQIGTSTLAKLEKWAEDFSLYFSHEKSKFTMFKHRKNITHIPTIKLLSKRIQYTKELKYLG
ncbi:Retrovirus-related Pol polyprotein from type-1 retrotransposable element R1 [Araneus ventricosus]|uniref:Retrovirus-related Pol polyprotein from type-1 retrotransposable element R1 n=1 Tax=Araneus ventricosus TaxID=182803 RepID=A0A4Y2CDB8_ARAVE|nr:Retrovirus-related Pol polyprotein from type-1 retrotransposable element R1 [Araneus ventricosus]